MEAKQNVRYWNDRAVSAVDTVTATHPDRHQRRLEIEQLELHWPQYTPRVLDVGCGAGYTSSIIASVSSEVVAVDRSEEMVAKARAAYGTLPNVSFQVGDVLGLAEEWAGAFDVVISQRVLINLSGWEEQRKALDGIARVLKPGGRLFLQEGSKQGREKLNQLREKVGLKRMPVVEFNRDLDEERLWPYVRLNFEIENIYCFGLYDLLSRVYYPLLASPAEPAYESRENEVAVRLASAEFGIGGSPDVAREFSAVLVRRNTPTT